MRRFAILLLNLAAAASPLAAQQRQSETHDTAGAFADAGTAALLNRARATRLHSDSTIRSYTAMIRSRLAGGMRLPMKDRTIVREETAARVRWSRDAATVIQRLAGREQTPGGIKVPGPGIRRLYDPATDRMTIGFDAFSDRSDSTTPEEDNYWIEHPLGRQAERHYRYESGDTLSITLQDGTVLRAIELRVIPRRDDPHTVRGILWIDPASGAVSQAAFRLTRSVDLMQDIEMDDEEDERALRLVPGFLRPITFDISIMTVEYSLWDLQHWLPRTTRFEGSFRVGALRFPGAVEVSYDIEDVETDTDGRRAQEAILAQQTAEAWAREGKFVRTERKSNDREYIVLTPADSIMLNSPQLPPPVWQDAPGFATEDELERMADRLKDLPAPFRRTSGTRFGWGFGEPDMVRYNRVEALSIGARATVSLPVIDARLTARLGAGDLHPNAELALIRATPRRTLILRGYHELATADESRRALGLGNSLSSLLFGRDEGEYYRASGAAFTWAPASDARQSWDFTGYVEWQNDVARETHIALPRLWQDSVFRSNITAAEALQQGALLRWRPWWGTDPRAAQFGIDAMLNGEVGKFEFARARLTLRAAAPLFAGARVGAELAAGTAEGDVTPQRLFYLGGASTLRGYAPGIVAGSSMARARLEVARAWSFGNLVAFSDWGWAGDRDMRRASDEKLSAGAGLSIFDGVIRFDLARALRAPFGWRLDVHVDAVL